MRLARPALSMCVSATLALSCKRAGDARLKASPKPDEDALDDITLLRDEEVDAPAVPLADDRFGRLLNFVPNVPLASLSFDALAGAATGLSSSLGFDVLSNGRWARYDTFEFRRGSGPLRIHGGPAGELLLPFGFESNAKVLFTRTFASKEDPGLRAPQSPGLLLRVPVNAKRALALEPGEAVHMTSLSRVVTRVPGTLAALTGGGATATPYLTFSGTVSTYVLKVTPTMAYVRLQSTPRRQGGITLGAKTGGMPFLGLTGLSALGPSALEWDASVLDGRKFDLRFEIDLRTPEAQEAYDRALSGRARFTGKLARAMARLGGADTDATSALQQWSSIEDLARRDAGLENPRVRMMLRVDADLSARVRALKVKTPFFSAGLGRTSARNVVDVEDAHGQRREYAVAQEVLTRSRKVAALPPESETLLAAVFHAVADADTPDAPMGFALQWMRFFSPFRSDGRESSLQGLKAQLGPTWVKAGFADLEPRSPAMQLTGQTWTLFKPTFFSRLFDARSVSEADLWNALARMVERFDNTGTPLYNQGPYTKRGGGLTFGLPAKEDSRLATLQRNTCDTVVRTWGRWYCGYFAHDLIPGLLELQRGSTPKARTAFLDAFARPLPLSPVHGATLLARYFHEIIDAKGWTPEEMLLVDASFSPLTADRMSRSEAWPKPEHRFGDAGDAAALLTVLQWLY